jgi:MFS family permease
VVDGLVATALAGLTLWIHAPLISLGLLADDGYLAYGVQRLADGEVLYRDFRRTYTPGIYYFFVPVFEIFGRDLVWARAVWLMWHAALAALTYLVARPFAPRWAALWLGLVPILLPPPPHKMFVPVTVVAGLAICRTVAWAGLGLRGMLVAGVGIGAIALFRQEVGAYALVIAAFSIPAGEILRSEQTERSAFVRRVFGLWAALGAGVFALWGPFLAAVAAQGALPAMLDQVVLDGVRVQAGMELPFPPPTVLYTGPERFVVSLFYVPAAAAVVAAAIVAHALVRRRLGPTHLVLAQWAAMTGLMHGLILFRSDLMHLQQILVAPALIMAYLAGALWKGAKASRSAHETWAARLALGFLVVWGGAILSWGISDRIRHSYSLLEKTTTLNEPRARMKMGRRPAKQLEAVLDFVRTRTEPGEPVFVAPYAPIVYFLSERPNPTPYDLLLPGHATAEVQKDIIDRLERSDLRVVVVDDVRWDGDPERRFLNYARVFTDYLNRNFVLERRIGKWALYVRRSQAAAG